MKLGDVQLLKREDIPDLKGEGIDKILLALNTNTQTLRDVLGGNFGLEDNAGAKFVTVKCTHGVETFIKNPFAPQVPRAVVVAGYDGTLQLLGEPLWRRVNSETQPDVLGLKVAFDLAHTQPCLIKTASAVQSLPNGANTIITGWDVTEFSRGNVITDNGSVFTVSEAGTYTLAFQTNMEAVGTYITHQAFFDLGTYSHPRTYMPVTYSDAPRLTATGTARLAAGATFNAQALQAQSVSASRNILGGVTGRRIAIHRLYNDTVPIANVTFLLVRG